ncbi:MAG TPA: hypothetical protein VMH05_18760 [Bryobacteraceae bacterium]|nr:hypothetical protein [Bryobacteraceae bacterium]
MTNLRTLALTALLFATAGLSLNAQITDQIKAHINHNFVIGDKALPPGEYTFRMEKNSGLNVMRVENQRGENVAQFEVRETTADHRPRHSELVFRKYGDTEFLRKIFEGGSRTGSEVTETGKQEARLVSQGQHFLEHTEEQQ